MIRVFDKNTHGKIVEREKCIYFKSFRIINIQDIRFHRINTIALKI